MIPKKLHIIWVGNQSKRPDKWIQTWRDKHPDWEFKLWGNMELDTLPWRAGVKIKQLCAEGRWEGVADLMRYEILHDHGGVYVDADSQCIRKLDDWLLASPLFAVWESETHRPGLIANTFIGAIPQHPALAAMIAKTPRLNVSLYQRDWKRPYWKRWRVRFHYNQVMAWESTGPAFFTRMITLYCPMYATILPSILFLPKHHLDSEERLCPSTYARHEWGTTHQSY